MSLEQKLTNYTDKDIDIELEPLDSRGIYINPREGTITRKDVLKNISNSIIHSKKYTLFYTFIIILSIIMLIASFRTTCLSLLYLFIDYFINIVLIAEVLLRINALGKHYWKSFLNIVDLVIVPLCVITVIYLTVDNCSNKEGKIADNIILGIRNTLQLIRLLLLIKNNQPFSSEVEIIDIESIEENENREIAISEISDSATVLTGNDDIEYLIDFDEDYDKDLIL